MNLTIDDLKAAGAFTGAPVAKEIKFKIGDEDHTATVYVRRVGYAAAVADLTAARCKSDPVAGRIASSICDAEGKAMFSPGDITGEADPERGPMDHGLVMELMRVMGEVNGAGKTKS
ncbi:MAG: phage tail protein [Pseudomonadales bacterium]|nr:phage tail protein [Pseudomonadales bacterium]